MRLRGALALIPEPVSTGTAGWVTPSLGPRVLVHSARMVRHWFLPATRSGPDEVITSGSCNGAGTYVSLHVLSIRPCQTY